MARAPRMGVQSVVVNVGADPEHKQYVIYRNAAMGMDGSGGPSISPLFILA
jgi:hypothetical protein